EGEFWWNNDNYTLVVNHTERASLLGDVNQDGFVNISDALQILRHLVKLSNVIDETQPFGEGISAAPIDALMAGNITRQGQDIGGRLVMADALQVLRKVVKLSNMID
ncbi:MAG: dockerin type I domain-containing protein, partial [Oscillospiraceae bacterium]|nr:dockerin type I domain-containing protein [Oscillospiraceae bacterium]